MILGDLFNGMKILLKILFLFYCSASLSFAEKNHGIQPTEQELKDLYSLRGKVHGEIIFSSKRGKNWAVWKINADGSGLKRMTDDAFNSRNCFWSGDYQKIYFNSDALGRWQIYSMDADGGNIRNLSNTPKAEIICSVSRDEDRIYFQTHEDGTMRVFVRDMKKKTVQELDFSEFPGQGGIIIPKISPDEKKAAFLFKNGKGAARSIYVGNMDDAYHVKNIIPIHLGCFSAWSVQSKEFIMCVFTRGGTALHIAQADGSGLSPITEGGRWNYFPSWSPNEKWFVWSASPSEFHDHDTGKYDLYIASRDDKKPVRLTFHPAADLDPSWRP